MLLPMEQSGPPADNSLVPYHRPLPTTVPQTLAIQALSTQADLTLDRTWGFLRYPADITSSNDYTQILGTRYALFDLQTTYQRAIAGYEPDDYEEQRLMSLLKMDPADRRMWYRAHLAHELRRAEGTADEPWLFAEWRQWTIRDFDEMNLRLQDGLEYEDIRHHLNQPNEHWVWQKPLEPNRKYPTITSWRMMKHITVHRLLWPFVWPTVPFTSRPVRSLERCTHDLCVNPLHFIDSSKRARQLHRGSGKGYKAELPTGHSIAYHAEHVIALGNGQFELRCPHCEFPASDYFQDIVREAVERGELGSIRGKMSCSNCRKIYQAYLAGTANKGVTRMPSLKRGETEAERWARKDQELENDGWPEFERDEPADPA